MQILRETQHKARKPHRCGFCGLPISVGETYNYQTNVYGGDLYAWKSHLSCIAIASELNMFDECDDGLTGDDFCDFIKEEYGNIMIEKFPEIWESEDYRIPPFDEQLKFVKKHYLK